MPRAPGDKLGPYEITVANADVTLVCSTGKVCGETKTDSDGEFLFKALREQVERPGFYALAEPGYAIGEGLELVYFNLYRALPPWEL